MSAAATTIRIFIAATRTCFYFIPLIDDGGFSDMDKIVSIDLILMDHGQKVGLVHHHHHRRNWTSANMKQIRR
eukprot:scaffold19927_cov64-Cylindrotheca_fusiformis.AAC.1